MKGTDPSIGTVEMDGGYSSPSFLLPFRSRKMNINTAKDPAKRRNSLREIMISQNSEMYVLNKNDKLKFNK